jgi:hypothetical protein
MKSSPPVLDIRRSVRRIERFNIVAGPTGIMGIVASFPQDQMNISRAALIEIKASSTPIDSMPHLCPVHCSQMDPTSWSMLVYSMNGEIDCLHVGVLMVNHRAQEAQRSKLPARRGAITGGRLREGCDMASNHFRG